MSIRAATFYIPLLQALSLSIVLWSSMPIALAAGPNGFAPAASQSNQIELQRMFEQANALITTNRPADAIPILLRAVALAPTSPFIHHALGVAYQNSRQEKQAIIEYKKALVLRPQLEQVLLNIALCYSNLNQYDESLIWYDKFLSEYPQIPNREKIVSDRTNVVYRKFMNAGLDNSKAGKNIDARQSFRQAVLVKPDSADAHFKLASAINLCGEPQQAIVEFMEALRLDPKLSVAAYNIAICYQNIGDIEQSISWYERFQKDNPHDPLAANIANKVEALREAEKEFHDDPNLPDYLDALMSNGRYYRWPHELMPISIYIEPPEDVEGYRPAFAKALTDSLDAWAKASQNRVAFLLVPDKALARVTIEWTSDPAKVSDEGRAVEQGWTKVHGKVTPYRVVLIDNATMRILTKSRKGTRELTDDDVKKACLHEVGHMLGLNGHSSNNRDVMFFSESPSVWPALSKRDKATILRLYNMYPERTDIPPVASMYEN